MKVSELIEALQKLPPEDEVVISTKTLHVTMGGLPGINVESVSSGFDWDDGYTFIEPTEPLYVADEEFFTARKQTYKAQEALWFVNDAIRKGLREKREPDKILESVQRILISRSGIKP